MRSGRVKGKSEIQERLKALQDISVELVTSRHHLRDTLSFIVNKAVDLMICDAGTLYLAADGDNLTFEVAVNHSVPFAFERKAIPVSRLGLAAHVYKTAEAISLRDVYKIPADAPYQFDASYDNIVGYRTRSVLIQPLRSSQGTVLGVLQLINRKKAKNQIWPSLDPSHLNRMPEFNEDDERLLQSFAAVASAALENAKLYKDIENLFEGFVKASVHAIEARDFATRGHSERVAALTVDLAEKVTLSTDEGVRAISYSPMQLHEIRYAALLHDFGKIGVREATLLKEEKLSPLQKNLIRHRFDDFKNAAEISSLRDYLSRLMAAQTPPNELEWSRIEREIKAFGLKVEDYWNLVLDLNQPTVLDASRSDQLEGLKHTQCCGCDGKLRPLLESEEVFSLNVKRGSLTEAERIEIESHVTHTYMFLKKIPWTPELARVPEIAYAHHERLDGKGYPERRGAAAIPDQSRIMAICDIFDALAANDRPYKPAVPIQKALDILDHQAKTGALDARFLKVFVEGRVYENPGFVTLQTPISGKRAA